MKEAPVLMPVILSGGSGTRLWPLSRAMHPKQFINLLGEHSLLQDTVLRLQGVTSAAPLVICNQEHRFMVAEQFRSLRLTHGGILLEPVGRNTAPAIAAAAFESLSRYDDPLLLIMPADHAVKDVAAFSHAVQQAIEPALAGRLVTFGVVPTHPETGYGYIKSLEPAPAAVAEFVEKPDLATAQAYLAAGDYFWNSGMFLFRARRYLQELQQHAPVIYASVQQAHQQQARDLDFLRLHPEAFAASPSDSIDYAVMEKTGAAFVVPMDAGWSDVGSWQSLWDASDKDAAGNCVHGDVLLNDVSDSFVHASHRLVAAVGVQDHVIVETADAVLVMPKSRAQDIKKLVAELQQAKRCEVDLNKRVYRPWGYYEGIDGGDRFQAKRIAVYPQRRLSLQMHHHRAEHWVVVKGTAKITRGDEEFILSENESTYIPIGMRHRLENPGNILLEIIEVQSGSYLGEDDIVRFEDNYGRQQQ